MCDLPELLLHRFSFVESELEIVKEALIPVFIISIKFDKIEGFNYFEFVMLE